MFWIENAQICPFIVSFQRAYKYASNEPLTKTWDWFEDKYLLKICFRPKILKYGNLDLDPKNVIFLTQLFIMLKRLKIRFKEALTQYLGIILRQFLGQFIVKEAFFGLKWQNMALCIFHNFRLLRNKSKHNQHKITADILVELCRFYISIHLFSKDHV